MRRNMAASLIEHGAIRTTEAKAKELRRFAEKLITIAKKGTLQARRRVISLLQDRDIVDADGELQDKTVVQKLFDEVAPRYADRPGGYTRIVRLSERRIGDSGVQVLLQLVEETPAKDAGKGGASRRKRRAARRHEAAVAPAAQTAVAAAEADEGQAGEPEEAGDEEADAAESDEAGEEKNSDKAD